MYYRLIDFSCQSMSDDVEELEKHNKEKCVFNFMKYPKQNLGAKCGGSIYIVMNKQITKTPQFREERPDNTIYIS